MTTEELRAAAVWLDELSRQATALPWTMGGPPYFEIDAADGLPIRGRWFGSDVRFITEAANVGPELARAFIADHPADDGEPVTEDWLVAAGFRLDALEPWRLTIGVPDGASPNERQVFGVSLDDFSTAIECFTGDEETDMVCLRKMPTRGDVRRLCAALNIPLGG